MIHDRIPLRQRVELTISVTCMVKASFAVMASARDFAYCHALIDTEMRVHSDHQVGTMLSAAEQQTTV